MLLPLSLRLRPPQLWDDVADAALLRLPLLLLLLLLLLLKSLPAWQRRPTSVLPLPALPTPARPTLSSRLLRLLLCVLALLILVRCRRVGSRPRMLLRPRDALAVAPVVRHAPPLPPRLRVGLPASLGTLLVLGRRVLRLLPLLPPFQRRSRRAAPSRAPPPPPLPKPPLRPLQALPEPAAARRTETRTSLPVSDTAVLHAAHSSRPGPVAPVLSSSGSGSGGNGGGEVQLLLPGEVAPAAVVAVVDGGGAPPLAAG